MESSDSKELDGIVPQVPSNHSSKFFDMTYKFLTSKAALQQRWESISGTVTKDIEAIEGINLIEDVATEQFNSSFRQKNMKGEVVQTLPELYELGNLTVPYFQQLLTNIVSEARLQLVDSDDTEFTVKVAPLKGTTRAVEKARDDYDARPEGPGIAWLYDIVRGIIICDTLEQLKAVLSVIANLNNDEDNRLSKVCRLKNRFCHPTPGGFRDANINILVKIPLDSVLEASIEGRCSNMSMSTCIDHMTELQVHYRPILELAKSLHTHEVYEFFRTYFRGNVESVKHRIELLEEFLSGTTSLGTSESTEAQQGFDCDSISIESFLESIFESQDITRIQRIIPLLEISNELELEFRARKEILKLQEAKEESLEALVTLNDIGILQQKMGDYEGSVSTMLRVLKEREALVDSDDDKILDIVNNLGTCYYDLYRIPEAVEMYDRALAGYSKLFGEDHKSTLRTIGNLANAKSDMGEFEEAIDMIKKVIKGYDKLYGANHVESLCQRGNLATVYLGSGKLEEAKALYEQIIKGFESQLGLVHDYVLRAKYNCAMLLHDMGLHEESKELYTFVYNTRIETLGAEHESTLSSGHNLALEYNILGRKEEARDMLKFIANSREKQFGLQHEVVFATYNDMATVLNDIGDSDGASKALEKAFHSKKALVDNGGDISEAFEAAIRYARYVSQHSSVQDDLQQVLNLLESFQSIWESDQTNQVDLYDLLVSIMEGLGCSDTASKYRDKLQILNAQIDSLPAEVIHKDHEHPLIKEKCEYSSGHFCCDVCRKVGCGWLYRCGQCGFDVHIRCAVGNA